MRITLRLISATFFIIGCQAAHNLNTLKRYYNEGKATADALGKKLSADDYKDVHSENRKCYEKHIGFMQFLFDKIIQKLDLTDKTMMDKDYNYWEAIGMQNMHIVVKTKAGDKLSASHLHELKRNGGIEEVIQKCEKKSGLFTFGSRVDSRVHRKESKDEWEQWYKEKPNIFNKDILGTLKRMNNKCGNNVIEEQPSKVEEQEPVEEERLLENEKAALKELLIITKALATNRHKYMNELSDGAKDRMILHLQKTWCDCRSKEIMPEEWTKFRARGKKVGMVLQDPAQPCTNKVLINCLEELKKCFMNTMQYMHAESNKRKGNDMKEKMEMSVERAKSTRTTTLAMDEISNIVDQKTLEVKIMDEEMKKAKKELYELQEELERARILNKSEETVQKIQAADTEIAVRLCEVYKVEKSLAKTINSLVE